MKRLSNPGAERLQAPQDDSRSGDELIEPPRVESGLEAMIRGRGRRAGPSARGRDVTGQLQTHRAQVRDECQD